MSAAQRWASDLASWGIPDEILAQAPQSPWIHPVSSFTPSGDLHVDTPSRHRALEAIDDIKDPSVLDVGCGGGRAAFGLVPPAGSVVGVDHQQGMLDVFIAQANDRGVAVDTVLGDWPDVAGDTPTCDVVVCHHVAYNVAAIEPFIQALHTHARRRVVLELPERHPLTHLSDAWQHFWNLTRPTAPTAEDLLVVIRELGMDAHLERWSVPAPTVMPEVTDLDVEHMRIRLCLSADRDPDVRSFLESRAPVGRDLAAIWWDVA